MSKEFKCCLGCTEREVGCHSWCERYERMKARNEAVKAKQREDAEARAYSSNTYRDRMDDCAKRKRKNRGLIKPSGR